MTHSTNPRNTLIFLVPRRSRCSKYSDCQVLDYNTALTGNGAEALVYADGAESSSERRGADESVAGNQLSGTFTLTLRGWETDVRGSTDEMRLLLFISCCVPRKWKLSILNILSQKQSCTISSVSVSSFFFLVLYRIDLYTCQTGARGFRVREVGKVIN